MSHLTGRTRWFAIAMGILLGGLAAVGQVKDVKPVTDAMLLNPDPADWLNFRRTLDGWGYSPLNQINRQNAGQLQLVWSWTLHPGVSEPTPAVSNGVMYIPNPGGGVQALDATNGDLLWDFRTPAPASGAREGGPPSPVAGTPSDPMRNIALYGDKVFTATGRATGARVIGLNARTGAEVWNKPVGYRHTAGPIIAKGKVVISTNGCERYKTDDPPCFIAAFEPDTGRELWRTSTIARPGEPGGDTWSDLPLMFRAGGDNWQAGSYDPVANLMFWGTAQAKPWARFQRGTDGDALYTNSTLAIDPDTGKIVWYFQHMPAETHDLDETFERILIDYDGRSSVFSMGKLGVLWENDRKTGAFRAAHDLGYQTIVSSIDPKTGRVTYRPEMIPKPGVTIDHCPGLNGVKSWRAMAYHPETQAFYIPLYTFCQKAAYNENVERVEGGGGVGGINNSALSFHPEAPETLGEFVAMNMKTGRILWRHRTRSPMTTAALTTGGGLAIVGDWDRYVYIHDVTTGRILFQVRLPTALSGFPITYSVRGRQYIAIPTGTGSGGGWANGGAALMLPEKKSELVNSINVFALPPR